MAGRPLAVQRKGDRMQKMPMFWKARTGRLLCKSLSVGLVLTVAVGSPGAAERCAPSTLSACRDTNELVREGSFKKEVKEFLSRQHGNYAARGEAVSDQALDLLGGLPDTPRKLGDATLFGACMAHNCGEKGAALLDPDGHVEAIGMLYACNAPKPSPDCFAHDTLTVFVRERDQRTATIAAISDWAKLVIVADNNLDPGSALPKTKLDRTQIVDVAPPHRD